jgi:hypothetical protein
MNRAYVSTYSIQHVISSSRNITVRMLLLATGVLAATILPSVPMSAQAGGELQQKLAAVKQSAAANQQRLHQYQWIETTQLTLNGDAKPPSQSMCQYGPNGQVQKTPMSAPPPPPSGGRLKQRIIANKTAEMKDYMGQVKTLLAMYVPPNGQHMQEAFGAGNASLIPGGGSTQLVFKNYAQQGDQMTLTFNMATKKITSLNVNTWMDNPKDTVMLSVQFATLPDGTNYSQQSVLNATAKKLVVTTTSSNYQPLGGQ